MTFDIKQTKEYHKQYKECYINELLGSAIDRIEELEASLIESEAKALFFRDLADGQISYNARDIWEFDTEPNASTGEKIRERYLARARKQLAGT